MYDYGPDSDDSSGETDGGVEFVPDLTSKIVAQLQSPRGMCDEIAVCVSSYFQVRRMAMPLLMPTPRIMVTPPITIMAQTTGMPQITGTRRIMAMLRITKIHLLLLR
jgi:hypothetical protein